MLAPVVEWSNGAESWLEYNGTCHNPAMALTQPHLSRLKCIHYAGPNMAFLLGVLREIAYELRRSMREILPPPIAPCRVSLQDGSVGVPRVLSSLDSIVLAVAFAGSSS